MLPWLQASVRPLTAGCQEYTNYYWIVISIQMVQLHLNNTSARRLCQAPVFTHPPSSGREQVLQVRSAKCRVRGAIARMLHPHRCLRQHVENPPLLLYRPLHDQ